MLGRSFGCRVCMARHGAQAAAPGGAELYQPDRFETPLSTRPSTST
jgi:hypothetical protein